MTCGQPDGFIDECPRGAPFEPHIHAEPFGFRCHAAQVGQAEQSKALCQYTSHYLNPHLDETMRGKAQLRGKVIVVIIRVVRGVRGE